LFGGLNLDKFNLAFQGGIKPLDRISPTMILGYPPDFTPTGMRRLSVPPYVFPHRFWTEVFILP
jgi:hypothetical protein